MKAWRKYNGTFWKENGPTLDKLFDRMEWPAGIEFIPGRLLMTARARRISKASKKESSTRNARKSVRAGQQSSR